jgi:uncharacterized protein YndB with AHSA1/START domain
MSRPAHLFETYIRATPEAIWAALTKPEFTRQYFFHSAVNSGWEPNGAVAYTMPDGSIAAEGLVVESDAPRRLVMTWSAQLRARSLGRTAVACRVDHHTVVR